MTPLMINRNRNRGFTLVEVLVVIFIIGALFGLTMLAVNSLGPSARLTSAGNQVVDVINHARQVAMAQNSLTMVAVIENGAEEGRALATLIYSPEQSAWTQIDRWATLPEGMMIDITESKEFFNKSLDPSIQLQKSGQTMQCLTSTLLPNGRPRYATSNAQVVLVKLKGTSKPFSNYYKIIVNQATGIPLVQRP